MGLVKVNRSQYETKYFVSPAGKEMLDFSVLNTCSKCHARWVRTGLNDKEIEWRGFTYIYIFIFLHIFFLHILHIFLYFFLHILHILHIFAQSVTRGVRTGLNDKEIEWRAFTYI